MPRLKMIPFSENHFSFVLLSVLILLLSSFSSQIESSGDTCSSTKDCPTGSNSNGENGTQGCCVASPTKLVLVQVIFRHGDRTQLFSYPTDPNRNLSWTNFKYPERKGRLTRRGKTQAYELGTFLRSHYKEHLKDIWLPEEISIQSSESDRAIMTVQTCLAGLFPPCEELIGCEGRWSREIRWQPLPVYIIPQEKDTKIHLYFGDNKCPAFSRELDKILQCEIMQEFQERHKETLAYVQKHTGLPEVTLRNIGKVYDTLYVQSLYDMPLPEWTEKVYPEPMKTLEAVGFQVLSGNRKMMRFNGGPLLGEVLRNMKTFIKLSQCPKSNKIESDDMSPLPKKRIKKLYLYSGHDTTVAAFLSTLNVFDTHQPRYTSAVMVELHEIEKEGHKNKRNDEYIVKVFYRNSTTEQPREMIIPGCGNPCHLDTLRQISRDLWIKDWNTECNRYSVSQWVFSPFTLVWYILSGGFLLCLMFGKWLISFIC